MSEIEKIIDLIEAAERRANGEAWKEVFSIVNPDHAGERDLAETIDLHVRAIHLKFTRHCEQYPSIKHTLQRGAIGLNNGGIYVSCAYYCSCAKP